MQDFVRHVCQRLCLQNRSKLSRHYPYVQSAIVGVSVVVMIVIVMVISTIAMVIRMIRIVSGDAAASVRDALELGAGRVATVGGAP